MRAFVTGATGFIGGALTRRLLADGWDVSALVRTPAKAAALREQGVTLVPGDVTERDGLAAAMAGHDAVFHLAAWYALGARDRDRMSGINVGGTRTVLTAATDAGVSKIVYCSSTAAIGPNPPGVVGDETREHPGDYGSLYEETKHQAHLVARELAAAGTPVTTVLPCAVYGPGDTSLMGTLLAMYARGWLLVCPFAEAAISFVHVDDVAGGIVGAFEHGGVGEDYILGGENTQIMEMFVRAAPVTGVRAPRLPMSVRAVSRFAPLGPVLATLMGQEPDFMRDAAANMRGSWLFSSAKAERELGYTWRSAAEGLTEVVRAVRRRSTPRL